MDAQLMMERWFCSMLCRNSPVGSRNFFMLSALPDANAYSVGCIASARTCTGRVKVSLDAHPKHRLSWGLSENAGCTGEWLARCTVFAAGLSRVAVSGGAFPCCFC
jgi:hypothetical protein